MKNIKEIIALICCCNLVFPVPIAMAAPQGGKVVGGSAHIHQSGGTTTINQSSNRAVINWNSFDIGKNETVRHNMPSANSAGLHRVVGGGGASQIMGQLQSNGNVYLVNPAGVVIHKGARIDVNSFTATSRDISNDNFMKGNMVFDKPGRPDAEVINQGTISVKENGLAALVAPTVRNDGVIAGKLAKVALASGDSTWKLDMHGDDLITFTVDEKDVDTLHAVDGTPLAGVENSGSIKAEGGVVVLTAAQLDGIVGSVVNSGEVSAASAELKGGKIVFKGAGSGVDIVNTGTVDASSAVADGGSVRIDTDGKVRSSGLIAATGGQKGGKVVVTGKDVALTGKAKIDVSGNKGGGTALVGGNALGKGPERNARTTKVEKGAAIVADARTKGDGGQVVVWSDEKTNFDGTITARGGSDGGNGGKVETSGKSLKVGDSARVDTRVSKGIHGQWLLDPMDFVIAESGGDMTGEALSANLETSNVRIESANGVRDGHGDIFVNSSVSWDADNTLSLDAERNIYINADITATGDHAGLNLLPAGDYMLGDAKITLSGADPRLSIKGEDYTVIHDVNELQDMNDNLSGYYALGVEIDASETVSWNDGEGFDPVGGGASISQYFGGKFTGLGHIIRGLTINRPNESGIGLFGSTLEGVKIQDVHLKDVNINGAHWVGGLVGEMAGTYDASTNPTSMIYNVSVSGKIEGFADVGGIVGRNFGHVYYSSSDANIVLRNAYGGGVVGTNYGFISFSSSFGTISGDMIGGFVGSNEGVIENSYASCLVNMTNYYNGSAGGFAGRVLQGTRIYNSYSKSIINGWGGGFIGSFNLGSSSLEKEKKEAVNCYWDKDVAWPDDEYSSLHGAVGNVWPEGSDWEEELELTALTSEQMKSQTSFQGWDFENVWAIDEGQSPPHLRPVVAAVPGPSPDPDPGTDPMPDPDPDPTPNPGQNPNFNTSNGFYTNTEYYLNCTDKVCQEGRIHNDYLREQNKNKTEKTNLVLISSSLLAEFLTEYTQFLLSIKNPLSATIGTAFGLKNVPGDIWNSAELRFSLSRGIIVNQCLYISDYYFNEVKKLDKLIEEGMHREEPYIVTAMYDDMLMAIAAQKIAENLLNNKSIDINMIKNLGDRISGNVVGDVVSVATNDFIESGVKTSVDIISKSTESLIRKGISTAGKNNVSIVTTELVKDGISGTASNVSGKKYSPDEIFSMIMGSDSVKAAVNEAYNEVYEITSDIGVDIQSAEYTMDHIRGIMRPNFVSICENYL